MPIAGGNTTTTAISRAVSILFLAALSPSLSNVKIHSKNGGHVTAASTDAGKPWGFVFLDCQLTGDATPWKDPAATQPARRITPKADLGRPWRPYASVTFVHCDLGSHIVPAGWSQ